VQSLLCILAVVLGHLLFLTNLAGAEEPPAAPQVLTLEQFGRAAEIARLAAEFGLDEFSLRAVREALRPGPPTLTPAVAAAGGGTIGRTTTAIRRVVGLGQPTDDSAVSIQVEQRIGELDKLWRRHGVPAERVYETLLEVVLPESRSAEIFIYPQPVKEDGEPRSVGRLLARWAADARRIDDLKRRIAERRELPTAQLAAHVLSAQLAAVVGDEPAEEECLNWLEEHLKTDKLASSAELARHALSAAQRDHLIKPRGSQANTGGRRFRAALAGEEFFSAKAGRVLAEARRLPPTERYAYLKEWVLPGDDHIGFRLYGDFTPADAAPPVAAHLHPGLFDDASAGIRALNRLHTGGTIEAPALELVELAADARLLKELAREVEKAAAASDVDARGKLALMVLVRVAQGRDEDAKKLLEELRGRLATVRPEAPEWVRWPDLTAAVAANRRPKLAGPTYLLMLRIVLEHIQPGHQGIGNVWKRHIYAESAAAQRVGNDPHLRDWAPVSHDSPSALGLGMPLANWNSFNGQVNHFGGREHDFLYFRVPLRGNFELNAKLSGWREIQVAYAGVLVGLGWARTDFYVSHFGRQPRRFDFVPPLAGVDLEYDYRLVVEDDVYAAYINGRKFHEQRLPTDRDPWLALYQPASHSGVARKLAITGRPSVPESLELSKLTDLTGWLPYYPVAAASRQATSQAEYLTVWEKRGEEIRGERRRPLDGGRRESLLRYHRPLLEDGVLEYEFFYDADKTMVCPALDRLVFLLRGDGVAIHWLTDVPYDRTGLSPANVTVESANRRGPAALPLVAGEWNHMKLALEGDRVTLGLNGVEIYARSLERTNQRVFGLFHYADETEARVRNVNYRGDWPRQLPAVEDQELK
jgi:hypothetical protein